MKLLEKQTSREINSISCIETTCMAIFDCCLERFLLNLVSISIAKHFYLFPEQVEKRLPGLGYFRMCYIL